MKTDTAQELLHLQQELANRTDIRAVFTTVHHDGQDWVTAYLDLMSPDSEENFEQRKFCLLLEDAAMIHAEAWFDEHHDK